MLKARRHLQELSPSTKRVLMLMTDHHIGNFVIASPIVNRLAAHFQHPIDVMVNRDLKDLADALLHSVRIFEVPRRRGLRGVGSFMRAASSIAGRYRVVIDVSGGVRSAALAAATLAPRRIGLESYPRRRAYSHVLPDCSDGGHRIEGYKQILRCIGAHAEPLWTPFSLPDDACTSIDRLVARSFDSPSARFAVMHTGAGKQNRIWPAERFVEVGKHLMNQHDLGLVLIGGEREREQLLQIQQQLPPHRRSIVANLPLVQLLALLNKATMFVGNESGPMHMAALTACPIVTIYGPTCPIEWGPLRRDRTIILRGETCSSQCGNNRCVAQLHCLTSVSIDAVIDAVDSLLAVTSEADQKRVPELVMINVHNVATSSV